ncbi:unnamed protein product [Urochloa decumbens]|uniref:Protein kinase domain-containing protein n=1 Tax=Urochloa decumbens TaxID=240449 RepID=A0ABC9BPM8_9POAL
MRIALEQRYHTSEPQGTFRLIKKQSDVFSFGVLLIELITRKKPFVYRSYNDDSLISHFVSLLTIGNLVEIIDPQVIEEDSGEVQEVAALAAMSCTRLEGEDHPTMREVEMALENLQARKKPVLNNMSSKRYDSDQIVAHYKSTEDLLARKDLSNGEDTEQASRQYTLEEEMVMSARFPR